MSLKGVKTEIINCDRLTIGVIENVFIFTCEEKIDGEASAVGAEQQKYSGVYGGEASIILPPEG